MTNHPNRSNARTKDFLGWRIEVSRYVPIDVWWVTLVRLSDMQRFDYDGLGSRSYRDPDEAMRAGEVWITKTVEAQAEFARVAKP